MDTSYLTTTRDVYKDAALNAQPGLCCTTTPDGPCVFTGRTAIYFGDDAYFDDNNGHWLTRNQPLAICDKTAGALAALGRDDLYLSAATYFYDGGGCC